MRENPVASGTIESVEHAAAGEYYSVLMQIEIYLWLKKEFPSYKDAAMETRILLLHRDKLENFLLDQDCERRKPQEPLIVGPQR